MRVLVTGGTGFIGSHLCRYLLGQGHDVICMDDLSTSRRDNVAQLLDNPKFEFWRHDVCEAWHIECDRVYHLACPASPIQYQRNPVRTIKTAVLGVLNALELCRNTGARLLITSTSEVYGDPNIHPQPESYYGNVNPVGERSCYDEGKRVGESLAVSWARQYETDVRIARLFNVYGPNMAFDDGRMIPNFILQAMKHQPLTIYGDGNQTRSLCYVDDTVRGIYFLMELGLHFTAPPVMNIGNPDERTVLSIAQHINSCFGGGCGVVHEPLPMDDPKQRCPDITLAKKFLNWIPEIQYSEGIKRTIEWFKEQHK